MTDSVVEALLNMQQDMLNAARARRTSPAKQTAPKSLDAAIKAFNRVYSRASEIQQSEYHRQWAARMKAKEADTQC